MRAVLAHLVLVDPVDAHRDGDDQRVIGAWRHFDAIGVPHREPLPGDPPDQAAAAVGELTVAMTPPPFSMSIVSRIAKSFVRMSVRRLPLASFSSKVSRRLSARPPTKKTRFPFSSSIQKSVVKEKIRSRTRYLMT